MTLSIDGHPGDVSRRVTYLSASSPAKPTASAGKAKRLDDPSANQMEGQVADLKRRIPILKRLIADCDRLAADLDQEVRNEENRVRIHDPVHSAYSIYARVSKMLSFECPLDLDMVTIAQSRGHRDIHEHAATSSGTPQ